MTAPRRVALMPPPNDKCSITALVLAERRGMAGSQSTSVLGGELVVSLAEKHDAVKEREKCHDDHSGTE